MKDVTPRDPCDGQGCFTPKRSTIRRLQRQALASALPSGSEVCRRALTTAALSRLESAKVYLSDGGICRYGGKNESSSVKNSKISL